jgi:uncharacterized membrane protein
MKRAGATLWLIPLLCFATALVLAGFTITVDHRWPDLVSTRIVGGPAGARVMLSTSASAMVTLTSLVLTVTLVAVQLAMNQFSPRIVRTLLQNVVSQLAVGLFGGTFLYTLVVLRVVEDNPPTVPGVSLLVAYTLMISSAVGLVLFVHRASQSLRVAGLIDLVGDETREVVPYEFPDLLVGPTVDADPAMIAAPDAGHVVRIRSDELVELARRAGCALDVVPAMGDFVPRGAPLVRVDGDPSRLDGERAKELVALAAERTHEADTAYGIRKLVDIAERAIAQPFNDPTTAVEAIGRIHDIMRQIASRAIPSGELRDVDGTVRLRIRKMTWEGYVRLAFDELRLAGARTPQVARALMATLADIEVVAPEQRRPAVQRQRVLLVAAVERAYDADADVRAMSTADAQGIGSGADVVG